MLSFLMRRTADVEGVEPVVQVGAIPYRIVDGHVAFLLVTSRRTGRWIYPKGAIIDGMTAPESAACEALEEAGVEGEVWPEPFGRYDTIKVKGMSRTPLRVALYPLEVTRQLDPWKESRQRHRHWALLPEARRLLSEPRLAEITKNLHGHLCKYGAGSADEAPTSSREESDSAQKSATAAIRK